MWHAPRGLSSYTCPWSIRFLNPVVFRVLKSSKTMNSDDFAIVLALGNESVPLKMPPVSRVADPDLIWSVDPDPYSES